MEFAFIIPVVVILAVFWGQMMSQRNKRQADNVKLLEKALENPAVDRATLESLTYQMTGRQAKRSEPGRRGFLAFVLWVGWTALFVGVALLVGGVMTYERDLELAGWIVGLIGLGFVTYPFALRELESRQAT